MHVPDLDTLPEHELQQQLGQMPEPELGRALNLPEAFSAGPREQRAIRKELGWREHERIAAAQAHDDAIRRAGFEDGFDVDITNGVPDPIADPLPDPVVNHVDDVVTGRFQPFEMPDPPKDVITPSTSPLSESPFVSYEAAPPKSVDEEQDDISVKFKVSFDDGFNDDFRSKFSTK
ncbi:hypothetical protein [Halorhabdus tiamatea]|uniref:hypothetical protein n=1 Tax=Halorhabdus tiamatea TaxID=430914 RepID=UPI0011D2B6DD|nr:hypothetical protein [Halorhabdus tiamatea]